MPTFPLKQDSPLPGFSLSLGYSVFYLSLIVLLPLSMLFIKISGMSLSDFLGVITSPRTLAALRLTAVTASISAFLNAFFGFIVAWVLVRYEFPGKKIMD